MALDLGEQRLHVGLRRGELPLEPCLVAKELRNMDPPQAPSQPLLEERAPRFLLARREVDLLLARPRLDAQHLELRRLPAQASVALGLCGRQPGPLLRLLGAQLRHRAPGPRLAHLRLLSADTRR